MNAPIILFAFNRLDAIKCTIESMLMNSEAADSDLFIFVDGPRKHIADDIEKVDSVQDYVKTITGFKMVEYTFSTNNKGLGTSVIAGVTQIIRKYGKAIIVEDDLYCSKNFLAYMNQGLKLYESNKDVFSICGYTNKVKYPQGYIYDAYACVRSSSWGWGTWLDRWETVDWELKDWNKCKREAKNFNRWGGSDCFGMLNDWHKGKNQSWAIRFCFNQYLQKKVSIFPMISKIRNDGFDGLGTNCKGWSRFKYDFDTTCDKTFNWPKDININKNLNRSALSYHSIWSRIYSRLMNLIINK